MDNNMQMELRETEFQVEQLKNIVGTGQGTAYHIEVSHGPSIGTLGTVHGPYPADAINDSSFGRGAGASHHWWNRAISLFRN